jgi:hypothetical protein
MILFKDYFILSLFLFVSHGFSKLLCDCCFGYFQGICLKGSLESDCSIELSRSPVDLLHFRLGARYSDVDMIKSLQAGIGKV